MTFDPLAGPFDALATLSVLSLDALALVVLLLLMAADEIGYRLGLRVRRLRPPGEEVKSSVGFVTGGMIGLMAFMLGISLSMASGRYEQRRQSALDEANAIGTTWLRAQAIGGEAGAAIQHALREYTVLRRDAVTLPAGPAEDERVNGGTSRLQAEMWAAVTTLARTQPNPVTVSLMATMNDMFDLALTNRRNFGSHVPPYVLRLLLVMSLLAVGAMGYNFGIGGTRNLVISALLLLMWTAAMVLVVDIDRPKAGRVIVNADPYTWTLQGFGPAPP